MRPFALVLLALVAVPTVARAQPSPPEPPTPASTPWRKDVSAEDQKAALKRFKEGTELLVRLQYAKALAKLGRAVKYWDHPAIRFNMVQALWNLDRPLEAYQSVLRALRFGQGPLRKVHYEQALRYKAMLLRRLARVTVYCSQPGVKIAIDGKLWFTGPKKQLQTRYVVPGPHQIVARKQGFIAITHDVAVFSGKEATVKIQLLPVEPTVVMRRRWAQFTPWKVVAGGGLATLIGIPLILWSQANASSVNDYLDTHCSEPTGGPLAGCAEGSLPQNVVDKANSARRLKVGAYAAFAVGGAVIATGIALLLLNRERPFEVDATQLRPVHRVTVVPSVSPRTAGLRVEFQF